MNIKRKYKRIIKLHNEIREIHAEIEYELNLISKFANSYIGHSHPNDKEHWFKEIKKEYINHSLHENIILPMRFLDFLNNKEKVECLKNFIDQKHKYIGALFPTPEETNKKSNISLTQDPNLCAHIDNLTDIKARRMIELLINYFEREAEKERKVA